ncbi:hypothetical protein BHE74_00019059, partial [Ensete ventricosum]
ISCIVPDSFGFFVENHSWFATSPLRDSSDQSNSRRRRRHPPTIYGDRRSLGRGRESKRGRELSCCRRGEGSSDRASELAGRHDAASS